MVGRWMGVAALLAALHGAAHADFVLRGPWWVDMIVDEYDAGACPLRITGDGQEIQLATECSPVGKGTGTFDPTTGRFSIVLQGDRGCAGAVLSGSIAPGGATFEADVTCGRPIHLHGGRCGNRVPDAGEECDDGNRIDGDCCSATCQAEEAGKACRPGNPCAESTCDTIGTCVSKPVAGDCDDGNSCTHGDHCEEGACLAEFLPDGAPCDDGDRCTQNDVCDRDVCSGTTVLCDGCTTCLHDRGCVPGPEFDCDLSYDAELRVRDHSVAGRDRLHVRLGFADASQPAHLGDPRSTSWDVCVFQGGGFGQPLLARATLPAGGTCGPASCWRSTPRGYRYRNGAAGAVKDVVFETGGRPRIDIRASGSELSLGTLPAVSPLFVQVKNANGNCLWASFWDLRTNGSTLLQARIVDPLQ